MKQAFYNSRLYYKFRYYFIRKKAPLSWIFWSEVLKRQYTSVGIYNISVAAAGDTDCAISLSRGSPKDNHIEILIYDSNNKQVGAVEIPLSYRSMGKVMEGFDKAFALSVKNIREENRLASAPTPQTIKQEEK